MASSNLAIGFVSYPTVVLAKSCKLLPTMLMGVLLENLRYSVAKWCSALLLSAGIALFHLSRHASKEEDTENSSWGIILLVLSLTFDGLLGSCQGLLKRPSEGSQRPPNAVETMLWVNLMALMFLVPASLYLGQWQDGIETLFHKEDNERIWRGLLALNGAAAIGQIFIFLTITWFSPLTTTTITTTRKFFTILLSIRMFGHQFSMIQYTSIAMVFGGLYLGIVLRQQSSNEPTKKKIQ